MRQSGLEMFIDNAYYEAETEGDRAETLQKSFSLRLISSERFHTTP